jgi:hypothetical protein
MAHLKLLLAIGVKYSTGLVYLLNLKLTVELVGCPASPPHPSPLPLQRGEGIRHGSSVVIP